MKWALLSSILCLVPLATCHFKLQHPPSRAGDDDEKQATFPCGGFDTIKGRTDFPLTGGSVQLDLGHDESLIEVLLALGNDPGDSFNLVWKPTVSEEGLGAFCFKDLNVPASLKLKDGANATIQVITNSHDASGLYNCADITFRDAVTGPPPPCKNGTNIQASLYTGEFTNANGTGAANTNSSSTTNTTDTGNASSTTETAAPAASTSPSAAALGMGKSVEKMVWAVLGGLVVIGGLTVL